MPRKPVVVKKVPKPSAVIVDAIAREKAKKKQAVADLRTKYLKEAQSFTVIFKYGPHQQFVADATDYDAALVHAKEMNKSELGKFGRRAAIYAIGQDGVRNIISYDF